jgi:hypothetical protein
MKGVGNKLWYKPNINQKQQDDQRDSSNTSLSETIKYYQK